MTLHVFNPEHDLALAANLENFTAPRAGRQLHCDLGFLSMLWAGAGDRVLVDEVEKAADSFQQVALAAKDCLGREIRCVASWQSSDAIIKDVYAVEPWGWDAALRRRLRMMGVDVSALPDDIQLRGIRELSHRRTAARLLGLLRDDSPHDTIGELPVECFTTDDVADAVTRFRHAVIKAPWSSSGRGLRFVRTDAEKPSWQADSALQGWLRNVIEKQGSVMVEPLYDKVKDFGMEFESQADGTVAYCGLSLFHTVNGAYTGNILATENVKREMMGRYVSLETLDRVKESICRHLAVILQGSYRGPLGIDMMVCNNVLADGKSARAELVTGQKERVNEDNSLLIHPCVEMNLRRTMGHVALALTPASDERVAVMQILPPSPKCSSPRYRMTLSKSAPPLRALS